jgi:SAM-dependent methyltransferase
MANVMPFIRPAVRAIPEWIRRPIRGSRLLADVRTPLHAAALARGPRRLDLCAAQFAHLLHLSGDLSLQGARCLELGSGWVLTHALVCHLLGAARVVAVDVEALARPRSLAVAVRTASAAIIRDLLAPFSSHAEVRSRLKRLLGIRHFDHAVLEELGITYIAPIDLATTQLEQRFDLIYSLSVLEHVPTSQVSALLTSLRRHLAPNGAMLHAIHLEDHRDFANDPFAFLSIPSHAFTPAEQSDRGNRLRSSSWMEALEATPGLSHRVLWSWQRNDRPLPKMIDQAIRYRDEVDLRTSHLGVLSRSSE